jgi:hypothetical protein
MTTTKSNHINYQKNLLSVSHNGLLVCLLGRADLETSLLLPYNSPNRQTSGSSYLKEDRLLTMSDYDYWIESSHRHMLTM